MSAPMPSREAVERAAAILSGDHLPPRHARAPIVKALEAIALAMSQSEAPVLRSVSDQPRVEA